MPLDAVLHVSNAAHQVSHVAWATEGFGRLGIRCRQAMYDTPAAADFCVVWGWRQRAVIAHAREAGMPVLVMERGHLHPRMDFTSLGWDGLGRRGRYPGADAAPGRWERYWGRMAPWRAGGDTALVLGQVTGDAALRGIDYRRWVAETAAALLAAGWAVRFRPHPNVERTVPIEDDLDGVGLAATFNSTSAVETVLAGVPTMTADEGAMAWPVTSHAPADAPVRPDRDGWVRDLACCQWTESEIRSGEALGVAMTRMEG